jgi:RND family efflux transporter MFP subunit
MRLRSGVGLVLLLGVALVRAAELATAPVVLIDVGPRHLADGEVEAVRQSDIGAQVAGRVVELAVTEGDRVEAGALLARIDARAASAQLEAQRALLAEAERDYRRNRELFAQAMISRTEMDRAEARYKSIRAQAGAAATEADFFAVRAPYDGIVAAVAVELGEMAQPGRQLLRIYDPSALRVRAFIPEGLAPRLADRPADVELPQRDGTVRVVSGGAAVLLPVVDTATRTREVRVALPQSSGLTPGQFVRLWLPLTGDASARLSIPVQSVVRRSEFHGVYVVAADGRVQLRQVRLGRERGDSVEVLAGLREGERVALDPLAAARVAAGGR